MNKKIFLLFLMFFCFKQIIAQDNFEKDTIKTSHGELIITFIGHGTLMFNFNDLVIHIDPVGRYADYSKLPKADIILITHHHGDHLDLKAIDTLRKKDTELLCTELCYKQLNYGNIIRNNEVKFVKGIKIEAVPAYNIVHKNNNGNPFHVKGECNGYVITFGDKRIYVAGDTENIPEMKELKNIDIAFLPMNLPYTMTTEMAADAVRMINPKIFYPYHYGNSNINELLELLKDKKDCEIRIRKMN
ncbi:MAG: MBL fold metallo-hydrolase [Melioribacter sp.]|uniref:MBL fold metallo-hydrolase n=1 Tax=Rosettibacter primus TaxID=3111523 RepID=UPI00247CF1AC|nr:MBL fold metallo-hydrolase [Melioribacter sp.]